MKEWSADEMENTTDSDDELPKYTVCDKWDMLRMYHQGKRRREDNLQSINLFLSGGV